MAASVEDAIAYLQKTSSRVSGGTSLYDHLADVIGKLLVERPENAVDSFEAFSYDVKENQKLKKPATPRLNAEQEGIDLQLIKTRLAMFKKLQEERTTGDETATDEALPDPTLEEAEAWEAAGISAMSKAELLEIVMSIKDLAEKEKLDRPKLWGKILGREGDYIICESILRELPMEGDKQQEGAGGETTDEEDLDDEERQKRAQEAAKKKREAELIAAAPGGNVPMEEENGPGSNKYTYWVCSRPGDEWVKLPPVTPAQIQSARRIRKFFTGHLDAPVNGWPAFPGNEANYLRAQIARISHGCQISPKGAFGTMEEEEEDPDRVDSASLVEMEEFTGLPASAMMDLHNWVHHIPALLNQGRCFFWRAPKAKPAGSSDEDGETEPETGVDETDLEGDEAEDQGEIEQGPQILTAISEDTPVGTTPDAAAWTLHQVYGVPGKQTCVVASSNRWPGAHTLGYGNRFAAFYAGFGLKYSSEAWIPAPPKPVAQEYSAISFVEAVEPTLEQEKELEEKARLAAEAEKAAAEKAKAEAEEAARKAKEEEEGGDTTEGETTEGAGNTTTTEDEDLDEEEEETDTGKGTDTDGH